MTGLYLKTKLKNFMDNYALDVAIYLAGVAMGINICQILGK